MGFKSPMFSVIMYDSYMCVYIKLCSADPASVSPPKFVTKKNWTFLGESLAHNFGHLSISHNESETIISSISGVSATCILMDILVLIPLRQLELITIYVIEARLPTINIFVQFAKMLMIYVNGRRFRPVAFVSARFRRIICLQNLTLMKATGHIYHLYKSSTSLQITQKITIVETLASIT